MESVGWYKNPSFVVEHLHIVGLEQVWRMFSPTPPHHHFWHVIEATLEDGSVVRFIQSTSQTSGSSLLVNVGGATKGRRIVDLDSQRTVYVRSTKVAILHIQQPPLVQVMGEL